MPSVTKRKPTPQEERDWARKVAKRKAAEKRQYFDECRQQLEQAFDVAFGAQSADLLFALEAYLDARENR